jgi:hypothetical protein
MSFDDSGYRFDEPTKAWVFRVQWTFEANANGVIVTEHVGNETLRYEAMPAEFVTAFIAERQAAIAAMVNRQARATFP